jgi:aldehyde:ferredoxin oxidoreductase
VSNRGGCHLNGGYMAVMEGLGLFMDPRSQRSKPALTAMFQDLMEAVSSAGCCLFTTFTMLPGPLVADPDSGLTRGVSAVLGYTAWVLGLLRALPSGLIAIPLPILPHLKAIELATGMRLGFGRLWAIGERGYTLERLIAVRLGLTAADDSLPSRLTSEPLEPADPRSVVPLAPMKERYYAHRGWDSDGAPSARRLRHLGLAGAGDVAPGAE